MILEPRSVEIVILARWTQREEVLLIYMVRLGLKVLLQVIKFNNLVKCITF